MSAADHGALKTAPAFQVYARDFLVDETARLSLPAAGAYMKLLCYQWINGPLPSAVPQLARLLGVPTTIFRPIWREISRSFPVVPSDAKQCANVALEAKRRESLTYRLKQRELANRRWNPRTA